MSSSSTVRPGAGSRNVAAAVVGVRRWLSSLDVDHLTDRERVDLVAELERIKHTAAASQARATHALRTSREAASPHDAVRSIGSEVALARRESPTLGDRFVGLARALVDEMPFTMRALDEGLCSERHALVMVQATSVLCVEDRATVDRRVGPLLARLGVRGAERAARRVAAELDAASVVRRMEEAVRSRRVTVRPAPDGMAYLTVLGPLVEVVGAYASLRARAQAVVTGQEPDDLPEGRTAGAVTSDIALQLLSGRAAGEQQPVEVHLVMTDRALLGTGDPRRSPMEPARIPGHGSLPAPTARARIRGERPIGTKAGGPKPRGGGSVWLRRLYTTPDGRDLVAMDSRRRLFSGLLRRMLVLRDDVCTTPWCEAPIAHADHTTPARDGGSTSFADGAGKCARCNYVKEAPGWVTATGPVGGVAVGGVAPGGVAVGGVAVGGVAPGCGAAGGHVSGGPGAGARQQLQVTTPLGRHYAFSSPPVLGWGSVTIDASPPTGLSGVAAAAGTRRDSARQRARELAIARRVVHRFPFTSHLERELCRCRT